MLSFSPEAMRDLLLHQVHAGDHLGDGVLDLEPRVHLHEVEVPVLVDQELDGAGVGVVDRLREAHGGLGHVVGDALRQARQAAIPR